MAGGSGHSRDGVLGTDQLQVELEASVVGVGTPHGEEVGGHLDVAGEGDKVHGVGEGREEALRVTLRAHERLTLASDIAIFGVGGRGRTKAMGIYKQCMRAA